MTYRASCIAGGLLVAASLAGCEGKPPAAPVPEAKAAAERAPRYDRELANLNAAIEQGVALSARSPDDGLLPLEVVGLYQERARLTGNYDDYARAQALLDSRLAGKAATASQCLAQARLHFTLHRVKQASNALATCPVPMPPADVAAIRADIAMYSGRYREADALYRALVNEVGLTQHFVRLALLRAKTGAPGEAAALLEAAEKRYHGGSATLRAWLKLQRGLLALDRGRFDEALAMYRLASDALPGWWLIDEHIAEVTRLRGDAKAAKALYQSVVERTQGPEFMDALAALEAEAGNGDEAKRLLGLARAAYEKRIAAFPEAAAGHALDHFLQDPADAKRALALAQDNFAARPYGEPAVALAHAWIVSGRPERGIPILEAQLAAGWDTAEAHWMLAQAMRKTGNTAGADRAQSRAMHRNPESSRMYFTPP